MVIPGEATPPGESVMPAIPDVDGRRSSCELILLPTLSPPILSLSLGDCFFVKGRERGRGSFGGIRSTGDRSSGISPFSAMTSSPGSSGWSPSGGESPTPPLLPFSPTLSPFCALERNRKMGHYAQIPKYIHVGIKVIYFNSNACMCILKSTVHLAGANTKCEILKVLSTECEKYSATCH